MPFLDSFTVRGKLALAFGNERATRDAIDQQRRENLYRHQGGDEDALLAESACRESRDDRAIYAARETDDDSAAMESAHDLLADRGADQFDDGSGIDGEGIGRKWFLGVIGLHRLR